MTINGMEILEAEQVAQLLGVTLTTLTEWRRKKTHIAFYRVSGKRVVYKAQDVHEYLERCRVEVAR